MFKGVINVFLIFIICITAAGMPVDLNAFDFSNYMPTYEENGQITYSIDSQTSVVINPTTVSFIIKSDPPITKLTPEQIDSFLLDISKEGQEPSTYSASDFIISQEANNDTEIILALDFTQDNLQLGDGSYLFKIYSAEGNFSSVAPLEMEVTYKPVAPYIAATNTMSNGLMNLTLYFPNNSRKYLVPITRFVNHSTAAVRTTVNNLHAGSSVLDFDNPIPDIPRLQVSSGTLTVHLPSNLDNYNSSEENGYFAFNSIVNSLTAVPGVDRIKFLVNGRESDDFFHGYNTSTLYEPNSQIPKAYLAMDIGEIRTVLVPIEVSSLQEQNSLTDMFNTLQTGSYNGTTFEGILPTIPNEIELLGASLNNNTVTLNLSKDLLYAYPEREDLQKLMIDSILYSYCSISGIENVQILVENQGINSFAGYQLSQPLSSPKYINPEKE